MKGMDDLSHVEKMVLAEMEMVLPGALCRIRKVPHIILCLIKTGQARAYLLREGQEAGFCQCDAL